MRLSEGGNVSELVDFVGGDFAEQAAHDFAGTGLGKTRNDVEAVRHGNAADDFADLARELAGKRVAVSVRVEAVLEDAEGVDGLALDLVSDTNDGGLGAARVRDEGGLEFGSAEAMARDVDNVVDAANDPVVSIGIAEYAVSSEEAAGVREEVGLAEAFVVSPNGASHAGPWAVYGEDTADILAGEDLAGGGVKEYGLDTKEGLAARSGLHACCAWQGRHNDTPRLGHPICIDNGALFLSNDLVVPFPCCWVDGLAYRA